MDKKNVDLLHGLLFAVCVIILVYSGEQVKTTKTGISSWFMRFAALVSASGIASLGLSFIPGSRANKIADTIKLSEESTEFLYRDVDGSVLEHIPLSTVKQI